MRIPSTDPVARHLAVAERCFEAGDVDGCDTAYRRAVQATVGRPVLREEVQEDHLNSLMDLGRRALALTRCAAYLDESRPGPLGLRVYYAEILAALGHYARADAEAVALSAYESELSKEQVARLHRVRGLALADDGRSAQALRHLATARRMFQELGVQVHLGPLMEEILLLLSREGSITATLDRPLRTVPDHLHRAEELRHQARYEEALGTLVQALDLPDFEPALYWPVVREMAVLAWALRLPDVVRRLGPLLWEAADQAPDRRAARAEADSLLEPGVADSGADSGPAARRFDARVEHVRRLLDDGRLDEAEEQLKQLRDRAGSPRDLALWQLAAAEAEWVRGMRTGAAGPLHECVGHAALAATYAWTDALVMVRIDALRLLGHALDKLDFPDSDHAAGDCWAQAHRLEEMIASRQCSDARRVNMLIAAPNEHDERVRAAFERTYRLQAPTAAGIAVAMEAARGALILPQILPADARRTRELPRPRDWAGSRRWVARMAATLPRDQAAWLIHATPDHIHHAVVGRDLFHHIYVESDRKDLYEAIGALARCWDNPDTLETSVDEGEFDRRLAAIATRLAVGKVIDRLPAHVRRLAVVAGDEVSDVPFAALPLPDEGGPLGRRYALSDLPCLSALAPLRQRSNRLRGDAVLLVQPERYEEHPGEHPGEHSGEQAGGHAELTPALAPADDTLGGPGGPAATPDELRDALATHRHQIVRIDGHGIHDHADAKLSIIRLSPPGAAGHLRPEDLERMDLSGCGTLVLGACESGMAQRLGRDERHGFVRAAFNAGAAAVVAARWIAPDATAAPLLDRFQLHLRRLPRDLALQAAMRDICAMDVKVPFPDNPSRWACWSVYGDSGPQTKAGPLRRRLRGAGRKVP